MERLGARPKRSFGLEELDVKLAKHISPHSPDNVLVSA
jgi:hypothetical protein